MPPYPCLPVPTPWGIPQDAEKLLLQTLLWHYSGSLHPTRIWPWPLAKSTRASPQCRQIKSKKLGDFPPPQKIQVCCKSHNLVYCLTCKICGLQYVGQTKRTFHERLYEHFRDIRNKDHTKPLRRHFALLDHTPDTPTTPPLLPAVLHTSTSSSNWHVHEDWYETSGICF